MPMPLETPISTLDSQRPPCRLRSNVDSWDEWPWSVENETIKPWQGTLESKCDLKKPQLSWDLSLRTFRFSSLIFLIDECALSQRQLRLQQSHSTRICVEMPLSIRDHTEKVKAWRYRWREPSEETVSICLVRVPHPCCLGKLSGALHVSWYLLCLPGPIFWVCCTVNGVLYLARIVWCLPCLSICAIQHASIHAFNACMKRGQKNPPHKINIAPHAKGNVKISWRTSTRNEQIIHDRSWFHWHHGWGIHTLNHTTT